MPLEKLPERVPVALAGPFSQFEIGHRHALLSIGRSGNAIPLPDGEKYSRKEPEAINLNSRFCRLGDIPGLGRKVRAPRQPASRNGPRRRECVDDVAGC
jgi:hypothetical protein